GAAPLVPQLPRGGATGTSRATAFVRTHPLRARRPSTIMAFALIALFGAPAVDAVGRDLAPCDVGSCDVAMALEDRCPCEVATSHARYIRCVAHAAKRLAADGVIAHHCRRHLVRFAANGVCGVSSTAICLAPTSTCTDDGTCTNDPNTACDVDTD